MRDLSAGFFFFLLSYACYPAYIFISVCAAAFCLLCSPVHSLSTRCAATEQYDVRRVNMRTILFCAKFNFLTPDH